MTEGLKNYEGVCGEKDYKARIIELLDGISNEKDLRLIYLFVAGRERDPKSKKEETGRWSLG